MIYDLFSSKSIYNIATEKITDLPATGMLLLGVAGVYSRTLARGLANCICG